MHYTKEEFWDATHSEIYKMWKEHIKFNGWEVKSNTTSDTNYKKVNIEDIPFL
ncbi:hypothetical protein [Clostridium cochlearium]|uniref:hypothetical protein n=1 Tax=Clostridium cochlearium TaxID=1494 RepID=UPI001678CF05|nr:hypothetical protein [Clostridium cochlearium]